MVSRERLEIGETQREVSTAVLHKTKERDGNLLIRVRGSKHSDFLSKKGFAVGIKLAFEVRQSLLGKRDRGRFVVVEQGKQALCEPSEIPECDRGLIVEAIAPSRINRGKNALPMEIVLEGTR